MNLLKTKNVLVIDEQVSKAFTSTFVTINETIKYDVQNKILYEKECIKKLSISERELLAFFIKNQHRTLYTQEIKNHMWEDSEHATDSALKSVLHKLRDKIGKNSIKNISGIGYYLSKSEVN